MNLHITRHRKIWFSLLLILVGLSLLVSFIIGPKLGLDFTGGARWEIKFEDKNITAEQVRSFMTSEKALLTKGVRIQTTTNESMLITLENLSDTVKKEIASGIETKIGKFSEVSYQKIDSAIGKNFKTKAVYAIGASLLGIILFIAFAFRHVPKDINPWRFGAVTIIALFHDTIILFGIFVVLGKINGVEMDLPFLTALLATLGLSVNDTVVILDRLRENIRIQKAHETFEDTVEKSIQETLRRSIFTSLSTIIPLIALLFLGASSIFYFVLALAVGIAIGTYSSIFIAAPLLVTWKDWADKKN